MKATSKRRPKNEINQTSRVECLKNFAWDRVDDGLLDEVKQVLHRNGFDNI